MGLDIYAGTLTRYYSHNWKTVVQQWAEENGYSFNRITPDGEPADDEELSPTEVQAAVEDWRDQILNAISQPGQPPYAPWPENNEKPYYTDKPDWDAFGAMLLVAACHTYEEPVPPTVFTFAHGGAFEAGILPVLNVITMSLFMTAVLEYTGSLIAPIVIHFLWNGVGAIILGGVSLAEDYPHLFDMTIHGNPILSGGSCKIEGSIIVLFMNLAFLIGFVAAKKRKDRNR